MIRIPLAEATHEQLKAFAELGRGIPLHPKWNANTLRAKISESGWTHDFIELDDDADVSVPKQLSDSRLVKPAGETDDDNRMVRLFINKESHVPGGKDPVPVVLNGVRIDIPRGEQVSVKAKYARVLRDAVMLDYPQVDGVDLGALGEPQEVPRFPVTFYDPLDMDAVRAA